MVVCGETIFIQDKVETSWNPRTKEYYESLGYIFTGHFSKLVIHINDLPKASNVKIEVRCPKCGKIRLAKYSHIAATGNSQCQVCSRVNNRTGQKFGRLTAIKVVGKTRNGDYIWECKCECGNIKNVTNGSIGKTIFSCGCLRKEVVSERRKNTPKEKHYKWNPNLTDEERDKGRNIDREKLNKWRSLVHKRDTYTCQVCKKKNHGKIQVHHLLSYRKYPQFRFDVSNGITLCIDCHKEFHHKFSYSNFTGEDFIKFRKEKQNE